MPVLFLVLAATAPDAWAQLQQTLPGTWTAPGKPDPLTVTYALISNESALVEAWGVGGGHETQTVFHRDHTDVLLTHYCAQGNQPRLKLVTQTPTELTFRLLDVSNREPDQAVLVERTLRFQRDAYDDIEIYEGPDGKRETTTRHFSKALSAKPEASSAASARVGEGRAVPAFKDGVFQGYKLFSIHKGSRLDQRGLQNGDTVLQVDGAQPSSGDNGPAFLERLHGPASLKLVIERRNEVLSLPPK